MGLKKYMKKGLAVMLIAFMIAGFMSGCNSANQSGNGEEEYMIGMVQLVCHDAANISGNGFKDALSENGFIEGENLTIVERNGQNEQSNLEGIAQGFINDDVNLICAISTSAAQVMAAATDEIPILGSAVTDYEEAGLVKSNEKPGYNITGTSDQNPVEKQGELLLELVPDAKSVGILYNTSEINSKVQLERMEKYMKEHNVKVVRAGFSNINDMQQTQQNIMGKVDAIYIPTDNTVASSLAQVVTLAEEYKTPVICGETAQVEGGGIATYGIDYYQLGYRTGEMAAKILKGEAEPSEMPIEYASDDELTLVINKGEADRIGLTVPQDLLDKAKIVETKK